MYHGVEIISIINAFCHWLIIDRIIPHDYRYKIHTKYNWKVKSIEESNY